MQNFYNTDKTSHVSERTVIVMGIIHVLDKHTANLIAAGEVVERPASAVKELLENSADAGATKITVELKNGGVLFLRITDNGCGMAREDVPTAVLRHATSKIRSGLDLEAIKTLGFRGEALAAICAVSDLRMLTKRREDEAGTLLVAKHGEVVSVEEAGCPDGTTIIVESLFENVPARRKFLKKDFTEAAAVLAACEKYALSRPEIAVTVISDGSIKLQTPGDGELRNAIYATLGREFAGNLLPLEYTEGGVRVYGFIGKPEICRPNRNLQNFFVNSRYVKTRTAMAALEQGFHTFCPAGKFPACVLFIELGYHLVDVNIHPAKLEIKFTDERRVFDTIYFAVKNALSRGILLAKDTATNYDKRLAPEVPPTEQKPEQTTITEALPFFIDDTEQTTPPFVNKPFVKPAPMPHVFGGAVNLSELPPPEPTVSQVVRANTNFEPTSHLPATPMKTVFVDSVINAVGEEQIEMVEKIPEGEEAAQKPVFDTTQEQIDPQKEPFVEVFSELLPQNTAQESLFASADEAKPAKRARYIGEAFHSYLVAEAEGALYLIDKHAAHERILYEAIKSTKSRGGAQVLLEPIAVTLTPKEFAALSENASYFESSGFTFEEFGANTVLLRSYPEKLDIAQIKDTFTYLAGAMENANHRAAGELFDKALFSAACKAAVKAGQIHDAYHNEWIVEKLFADEAVLYCPHGRPVLVEYTKEKLDRMFGRT